MFFYGDVAYAQTWQLLTLKNCIEPFSYANTAYVVASALVSARLFCKNLGNLQKVFWVNGLPPPLAKNSPCAYGFLDATYKTSRYALPLFFLYVKTNVNYCVVESFVIRRETRQAICEALDVLREWNICGTHFGNSG